MQLVSLGRTAGAEELAGAYSSHALAIRPATVLRVVILLLVVGNVGRIPVLDLGDRAAPLLINDIALMFVVGVGALAMLNARSIRLTNTALAGMVFIGVGALSAIAGLERFGLSPFELLASLAYLARWTAYFALYVVIINCVKARDAEMLWNALEWALILMVAFGVVQAIFLPNFAFVVFPEAQAYEWDAQKNRLVSTILEPNVMAGMIVTVLLVQLARMSSGAKMALWKPVLLLGGLVMTQSRGGLLSFTVGAMGVVLVRGISKRVVRFGLVMSALALAALPKIIEVGRYMRRFTVADESAQARIMMWLRALDTFLDYPWFGIGFNTYGFVQERRGFPRIGGATYSVEGGLLFVAVMTGIVGVLVYVTMLWTVLKRSRSVWHSGDATPAERGLLVGTGVSTVAVLVNSLFVNSLLTPWVMEPLYILWALAFLIAEDLKHRSTETAV